MLDKQTVAKALEEVGNTILNVKFLTQKGEEKTYSGRINCKNMEDPSEASLIVRAAFAANGLVPLKTPDGFKSFRMDKVISISGCGKEWV